LISDTTSLAATPIPSNHDQYLPDPLAVCVSVGFRRIFTVLLLFSVSIFSMVVFTVCTPVCRYLSPSPSLSSHVNVSATPPPSSTTRFSYYLFISQNYCEFFISYSPLASTHLCPSYLFYFFFSLNSSP